MFKFLFGDARSHLIFDDTLNKINKKKYTDIEGSSGRVRSSLFTESFSLHTALINYEQYIYYVQYIYHSKYDCVLTE